MYNVPNTILAECAAELLAMLKELEWVEDDGCIMKCPVCGQWNPEVHGEPNRGHDADCALVALIAKAEGK